MFATLDPVSRRLRFPREREVIITDTVGFIRDLPRELLAAFRATLEELTDASLLLHVVDVSNSDVERRVEAVHRVIVHAIASLSAMVGLDPLVEALGCEIGFVLVEVGEGSDPCNAPVLKGTVAWALSPTAPDGDTSELSPKGLGGSPI